MLVEVGSRARNGGREELRDDEMHVDAENENYKGPYMNGLKHGHGSLYDPATGETYTGEFVNDQKHGIATNKMWDGSITQGQWLEGKLVANYGALAKNDQGIYEPRHSKASQDYPGIVLYRGDFENGLRHGHGLQLEEDGEIYVGEWIYDKKQGNGS